MRNRMSSPPAQRGAIAIMAAIGLSLAVVLLASIDIGYLFYAKRDLQKIVDMAALAGATQLSDATCASLPSDPPIVHATQNAKLNAGIAQTAAFPGTLAISCGYWTASPNSFAPYVAGQLKQNAVRVEATRNIAPFFGMLPQNVRAAATAAKNGSPVATFSVGSKLLQVNGGVVPGLLTGLGLNLSGTSLLSYQGLANVSIKTGGLLQALGFNIPLNADVGTVNELVKLGSPQCPSGICPLSALVNAIGTVGGQQNLVNSLGLQVSQLALTARLLTDENGRGVLTMLDTSNGKSALNLDVNALDLLTSSLGVANNTADHPGNLVSLPLSVGGGTVTAKLGIVEPPSTVTGGIGTTAYSAQIRVFLRLQSSQLPLLQIIPGTNVDLPIAIDLVDSKGTLTAMCTQKDAAGHPLATIHVDSAILKTCVGNIDEATIFSKKDSCDVGLQDKQLVSMLSGALKINTHFSIDAIHGGGDLILAKGQSGQTGGTLDLGTTLRDILHAVLGALLGSNTVSNSSLTNNQLATSLLSVVPGSTNALTTLNNAAASLQSFATSLSPNVMNMLSSVLNLNVINALSNIGGLVTGLVSGLTNLLANLIGPPCGLIGHNDQNCVAQNVAGSQTAAGVTVSNVVLGLMGLLTKTMQPTLDAIGNVLSSLLTSLLGINLGLTDVYLQDLNCVGDGVKLVQ